MHSGIRHPYHGLSIECRFISISKRYECSLFVGNYSNLVLYVFAFVQAIAGSQ